MTIDARVFQVNYNDKVVELVIRKKKGERYYPICFIGFSETKQTLNDLGVEKTDKVRIHYTLQSKQYKGRDGNKRYSTSAIIDDVELLEKNAKKQTQIVFVDKETGEIIEDVNNN